MFRHAWARPALSLLLLSLAASRPAGRPVFSSYADVRAVLDSLADILPAELKAGNPAQLDAAWTAWIVKHDREIRSRLIRGDQDTIVNWLLFGTSFTRQPRAFLDPPAAAAARPDTAGSAADPEQLSPVIAGRVGDFVAAIVAPGNDERRLFAQRLFARTGYRWATAPDRVRLQEHLVSEVMRVLREREDYARELDAARRPGNSSEEFATRSKLFRERGLSLDTSILPSFALERSLQQMQADGLVKPGSVRRVAVIGPGLDFSDKSSGYDFYPQQTLQPFALLDTLRRLGLSDPTADVHVTTLDISPRVNDHLLRARARARRGSPYVLRLPLDLGVAWKPDVVDYWKRVGDRIGVETAGPKPPSVGKHLEVRTIRVRPQTTLQVVPNDLDIVTERFSGPPFDLVVATNVFIYYDVLDQSLALANIETMLSPGGFLLSNNALLELPISRIRSVGYVTTQYSDRPDDGDHIVWYRRGP